MRIILASSFVPFINGGARFIVEWLERQLQEHGHQVERFYLPFVEHPDFILEQMLAYRMMNLEDSSDLLVTFRPPSYALRHPRKVVWFIHHIRPFYDLADAGHRGYPDTPKGEALRDALVDMDTSTLLESRRIFSNSQVVADRLAKYNGIRAIPLFPPVAEPERFRNEGYGEEIVVVCRVEPHKRQSLLVEAMEHTKTAVRLRLCGVSFDPAYGEELQQQIDGGSAADRIVYENRWITEEEKADMLATALAAAYLPMDEDSYGYPSLEAAHSRKSMITTVDSGGVLEFVDNGRNGFVVEPTPEAVAEAMDRLYADRDLAMRMGDAGHERLRELKIDWNHVVESILS
ncbi:MAG: glycosyltransferase family 4 protein [Rhizobiaceae bacterium]|nr:glycosyltransferase family 4 protein [Rhizobiaceae bacterium]